MRERQITIIKKEPGKMPELVPLFNNTLEAMQEAVGGYIETVTIAKDAVIICDEEGLLKSKDENVKFLGNMWRGTILIAGRKKDEFASLKPKVSAAVMEWLTAAELEMRKGRDEE